MNASKRIAHTLWRLVTLEGQPVSVVAGRFVALVREHHLENMVPAIIGYLTILAKQTKLDHTLKLTTSHEAGEELLVAIRSHVGAPAEEKIVVTVDPELIGGFMAEYNHKIHDGSLRHHLTKLEQALTN